MGRLIVALAAAVGGRRVENSSGKILITDHKSAVVKPAGLLVQLRTQSPTNTHKCFNYACQTCYLSSGQKFPTGVFSWEHL